MPEITVTVGGRPFQIVCNDGEEPQLQAAAKMLDTEAATLQKAIGRVPESRMLLMAGLMLADKTASVEDRVKAIEEQLATREQELESLRIAPAPEPERVEVPVVPITVTDTLAELAARAEALAATVEEKAAATE